MNSSLPTEGDPTDHISVDVDANPILVIRDDDGLALDEYFEGMPNSPVRREMVDTDADVTLPRTTRIIVNQFAVSAGECGFFFAADPNRQTLYITAQLLTGVVTSYVFASERIASVGFPVGTGFSISNSQGDNYASTPQEVSAHTGAVWILNTSTFPVTFNVTSVTV